MIKRYLEYVKESSSSSKIKIEDIFKTFGYEDKVIDFLNENYVGEEIYVYGKYPEGYKRVYESSPIIPKSYSRKYNEPWKDIHVVTEIIQIDCDSKGKKSLLIDDIIKKSNDCIIYSDADPYGEEDWDID
jgi:phosphoribosylpyrophosphate synthetase